MMNRILNMETLTSHGNVEGRKLVCDILEAGLQAGDPYNTTRQMLKLEGSRLTVGDPAFEPLYTPHPGSDSYDLKTDIDRVFVFAAGKGMLRVVKALEDVLGDYITGGIALVKYGDKEELSRVEVLYGAHPVPDANCVEGCRKISEMIQSLHLTPRDLVFTAIGNGVGSLLTYPAEGIPLKAVSDMVQLLQIEKGAPTAELSIVRNQVDRLKGGRITRLLHPAKMVHLLAVDCNYGNTGAVGYPGLMDLNVWLHTLPDCGSKEFAAYILDKWDAWDRVDESIRTHLQKAEEEQEVMRSDEFEKMDCKIYGVMPDKMGPLPKAMKRAEELGYSAHLINRGHALEASVMGQFFGLLGNCAANEGQPFPAPCALFYTGEMLVTVGQEGGVGGRDQECALSAVQALAGNRRAVLGCVDTDGTDGPGGHFCDEATDMGITALSGGLVDGFTLQEAQEKDADLISALKTHGSSLPLWQLNCGIWATQNISVQDLVVLLVLPETSAEA